MENLSLSVPDLLQTVKRYVEPAKHEELDAMLKRYMAKELGKTQVICGPPPPFSCAPTLARLTPRSPQLSAAPGAVAARGWA